MTVTPLHKTFTPAERVGIFSLYRINPSKFLQSATAYQLRIMVEVNRMDVRRTDISEETRQQYLKKAANMEKLAESRAAEKQVA